MERGRDNSGGFQGTLMLWLLPLTVWALATGYFGFGLGKYSDDWSQSFINPSDGSVDAAFHPWVRWPYFFRPVFFVVMWAINTAFWERDWARHATAAVMHLGVGVLGYRVLRRIGIMSGVAIGVVTVFLAWPVHAEAVLWPAAMGLPMGAAAFLMACERTVVFARRAPDGRPWWRMVELGAWALLAACCHEQTAAATAAIPALYLACCPNEQGWGLRVKRAMLVTAGCGSGCLVYIGLMRATVPAGRRGSGGSLVSMENAPARLEQFVRRAGDWIWGTHTREVVIDAGVRGAKIVGSGVTVWAWGSFVLVGVVLWVIGISSAGETSMGAAPAVRRAGHPVARTWWLVLFGVGCGVASLLPVAVTKNKAVASRYFYVLSLGIAIAAAAMVDGVMRWMAGGAEGRGRAVVPAVAMGLAGALGVWGALGMVWWQSEFRGRAEADASIGAQIRWLVPKPAQGAVIVPVSIARARTGGSRAFPDGPVPGALTQPWACWCFVQRTYGRGDISATHARPGARAPLTATAEGIRYNNAVCDAWGRGELERSMIPWEKAVPIAIDADGQVHLVTREVTEEILRGEDPRGGARSGEGGKDEHTENRGGTRRNAPSGDGKEDEK